MKIIINEHQEKLLKSAIQEAMDDSFDYNELKSIRNLRGRYNYCKQHLGAPIGKGCGRVVFQIDDEKVLKLAYNKFGVAQNEHECDWGLQRWDVTPNLYDETDSDDYWWLVSEYVLPATEEDFQECFGFDFKTFVKFIYSSASRYQNKNVSERWKMHGLTLSDEEYVNILETNENAQLFDTFIGDYSPHLRDILSIRQYGITNRSGEPQIVLLDYGLNEEIDKKYCNFEQVNREKPLAESIRIHKGEKGKTMSTQGRWEDSVDCPHCQESKAFFTMSISDGSKGRGRIKITDEEGNEKDTEVQTIALYYCPNCHKFTAINNMA
jgi:hypothetical protein